jgi:nicotinamidase-related amidase
MSIDFVPGDTVQVPEIPYADGVTLPIKKTALVVVDMQNDFVKPDGALNVPDAPETVPRIRALLETARQRGVHVAFTQDTHREDDPEWDNWPAHVRAGTWGWEIIDELQPQPGELVCQKSRYSGFYGTWLDHHLSQVWDVDYTVVVGTVSNICVLHTAAGAGLRFMRVIVPADGISALTTFGQAMTLRLVSWLYKGSLVRSTEDIGFKEVETMELPRLEVEWCWEASPEELSTMTPQEQRIAQIEAQLCEQKATIADLKERLEASG